jgi:hypothetical protein
LDFPGVRAFSSVPGHRNPAYMKLSTNFRWSPTASAPAVAVDSR